MCLNCNSVKARSHLPSCGIFCRCNFNKNPCDQEFCTQNCANDFGTQNSQRKLVTQINRKPCGLNVICVSKQHLTLDIFAREISENVTTPLNWNNVRNLVRLVCRHSSEAALLTVVTVSAVLVS